MTNAKPNKLMTMLRKFQEAITDYGFGPNYVYNHRTEILQTFLLAAENAQNEKQPQQVEKIV